MREKLVMLTARVFRKLPDFRGKFSLGMMMEKVLLNHGNTWKTDEVKLKLKSGNIMHLDPRSATHKAPFWTGRYDDAIIDQFTSVFQKDWVVMDIGANIGYYALSFARALKQLGGGTVIAVEPLPANAAKLQQHISLNELDALLTIERMALGDKNGTITIYATESGNTGNAYIGDKPIEQVKGTSSCDIPIERLDDCRLTKELHRCDFIKMDIEGAEILLLKGAPEFLKKFKPVIYGEFNSFFIEKFGYDFMDVADLLMPLDYKPFIKKGSQYEPVQPVSGLIDILWVPGHQLSYLADKGLLNKIH
jgi:FkbM family methyltransferase